MVSAAAVIVWWANSVAAQMGPPNLPEPVANNAVAGGTVAGRLTLYSMLGIDSTKRWSGITTRAYRWTTGRAQWEALPPVPGSVGRLAAIAHLIRGKVYLVGGYTVAADGAERSVAAVDIYDPERNRWSSGAPTPVAVDDAVSGVYRDSLLYLVSGWHDTASVAHVQIYDVILNRWVQGTKFPGTPVFGPGGTVAGQTIVVIDGAKKIAGPTRYAIERQTWSGRIDPAAPARIAWTKLADHPGPPRYRPASGACGDQVVILGGTANPYNYNGIGYDQVPSVAESGGIAFNPTSARWRILPAAAIATMDHRGLVVSGRDGFAIGGMIGAQTVTGSVTRYALPPCPADR